MSFIIDLISTSIDKTSKHLTDQLQQQLNQKDQELLSLSIERSKIVNTLKLLGKDPDLIKFDLSFLKIIIENLEKKALTKADLLEKMKDLASPIKIMRMINWLIDNEYLSFADDKVSIGFKFPNLSKYVSK